MQDSTVFEIDPELVAGFIDEAQEGLATLDNLFVKLEADPANLDIITTIFRPVHTIKGNSAFFGLMKTKKLAHEMETLLDMAKQGRLIPNRSVIDVLLAGVDQLKEILARIRDGHGEVEDENLFGELIEKVIAAREIEEDATSLWTGLFEKLEKVKTNFAGLDSAYAEQLGDIISVVHQLEANKTSTPNQTPKCQTQTHGTVPELLQELTSILNVHCEEGLDESNATIVLKHLKALKDIANNQEAGDVLESAMDECHRIVGNRGAGDVLLIESLQEKIEKLMSLGDWKTSPGAGKTETTESKSKSLNEKGQATQDTGKTMRVAEDNIDNFLNYVGELIVVGEMYNHLQGSILKSGLNTTSAMEFKRLNETFDNLSCNLQNSIMEIRKVPIRTILQKAPRMIRDIAADNSKEIKVEIIGEEMKVDKRLIEILDGPLTHMVRNAADHGIELPEDRQSAGKSRQGTVRIEVTETGEDIVLTISDDGKGIDLEAIKAKAVELGMIRPDQKLTEEQLIDILFASGVSTAEKVTEVSGRGVGMDVVKRNIEAANGKITINTKPGQGSEFVIRLQKTVSTQIIDGFLVRIRENRYVIPLDKVREVFRPEARDISTVIEKGLCVHRHDELLSVVRISDVLGNGSLSKVHDHDGIMVSTSIGRKRIAFCVDEVIGVQKLVLKDLDGLELNSDLYSAAAIMGDGTVAMLLDVDHLAGITVGM